jgi:tetratricopeptide (TPR) repeat protein
VGADLPARQRSVRQSRGHLLGAGDYDKALALAQEEMKLDPGSGINYGALVTLYVRVNRLDEARATAQEAQARNLDNPLIHFLLYIIDFLQHDAAGMERKAWADGQTRIRRLYARRRI